VDVSSLFTRRFSDIYDQIGHIRLPQSDRKWLAGKIAQKTALNIIIGDTVLEIN